MPLKIALIGYGAIARHVVQAVEGDPALKIAQVLIRPEKTKQIAALLPERTTAISDINDLTPDIDLVLECAGHEAVKSYATAVLERGIDFGLLSVGALADSQLHDRLSAAALTGGARLCVLAGAIGGIDALASAGRALSEVTYVSRKPPLSWLGSPAEATHDLAALNRETAVFKGSAREAALRFPKNANVVATVALAAIGFDETRVTLLADPGSRGNSHQITATGGGFDFSFATSGSALPGNPKTSALTALSALRALRGRAPGVVV